MDVAESTELTMNHNSLSRIICNFCFTEKNVGLEEKFSKMKNMYTNLREQHVDLLRKVRQQFLIIFEFIFKENHILISFQCKFLVKQLQSN